MLGEYVAEKALPMDRTCPVFPEGGDMPGRSVPLVALETIGGMLIGKIDHQVVASDFGNDACRGNAGKLSIALDDADLALVHVNGITIDEYASDIFDVPAFGKVMLACRKGSFHRDTQACGHATGIDFVRFNTCNAHTKSHFVNLLCQLGTTLGRELLGVIESDDLRIVRQRHAGNHERTGQRSPADLVDADDDALGNDLAHIRIELRSMYPAELFAFFLC